MTIIIYTNLNTLMEKQLIIIALTDIYSIKCPARRIYTNGELKMPSKKKTLITQV